MTTASRAIIILILLSICTIANGSDAWSAHSAEQELSKAAINPISNGGFVRNWIVVGPLPNPETEQPLPDKTNFIGYGQDYLQGLGGETKAVLSTETSVSFKDETGKENAVKTRSIEAGANGIVDFSACFGQTDHKVAYAFGYLQSEKAETRYCLFGSDDDAKVWVNDELVNNVYAGRSCVLGQDSFEIRVNKGLNPVLVKVCNRTGDWGMVLEVCTAERLAQLKAEQLKKEKLQTFRNCELRPQGLRYPYMFEQGRFPEMQWEQPFAVEATMGKFPLKVRWFDKELNEVTTAEKPGRYMALVEGTTPEGIKIRRAMTLYCRDKEFRPWTYYQNKACIDYIPGAPFDKKAWKQRSDFIASRAGEYFLDMQTQRGAIMMAYLAEMKPLEHKLLKTETPEILNDDYQLALKRKVLGVEDKWPKLKMPEKIKNKQSPVLHAGTPEEASVEKDAASKIRALCKEWYETTGEPFAILVARRGVIVIHEAFGQTPAGPVTVDTPMEIASITKLITGMMFAQFVDQGLINIDDPVGKYLPDFPVEGDKAITLHHCFTHTTGLEGHYLWGGMHNPWFDNVVASGLPCLHPGKTHIYNGIGYDLAGEVMEIVSGKSIFRLMHENFFDPLGVNIATMDDLAAWTTCSVEDIAKIGQLVLNKGSYGDMQFFSEDTFAKLMPQKLNKFYPDISLEWGIGMVWMRQPHPDAGKGSVPKDATILSKNVVGHRAASGAILRVDLDNDLVIAQTRNSEGKKYEEYVRKLLITIEDGLKK